MQQPPDLLAGIEKALAESHPLSFLMTASGLAAALDDRFAGPFASVQDREQRPSLSEFTEMMLENDQPASDALSRMLAELSGNDILVQRVRRELAARKSAIPNWLRNLDQVRPYRALESTDILRDAENVIIGVDLPGRHQMTAVVFVDHNMGTAATDAFVLDLSIDEFIDHWHSINDGSTVLADISLADARARVDEAIATGAMTHPPFESESWPMARPLVEWISSMLPAGGSGYERPEFSEDELAALTEGFFRSSDGQSLDTEDNRRLFDSLLWFGTDYGPGDPLRWSPTAIEILLLDFIPRKILAPPEHLSPMPELLRAFVRYAHAQRNVPADLTRMTIAALDEFEPEYQQAIREPRTEGPAALLEELGLPFDPSVPVEGIGGRDGLDSGEEPFEVFMLSMLAADAGGPEALGTLDEEPLPSESLNVEGIAEDIVPTVREIAGHIDDCATAIFDPELRTAGLRLLGDIARTAPAVFRRKSKTTMSAAAVLWTVGHLNGVFRSGGTRVKDMMAQLGLKGSPSQRAAAFLTALGHSPSMNESDLAEPRLLTSARREWLIEMRDKFRAQLEKDE